MTKKIQTTGEKIRILRKRKGLTSVELAKLIGVSHSTILRLESGEHKRSVHVIDIARVLGVDPYRLIDSHRRIKE